jgi:hypothetical protein
MSIRYWELMANIWCAFEVLEVYNLGKNKIESYNRINSRSKKLKQWDIFFEHWTAWIHTL